MTAWVLNPADVTALAKIKQGTGSNVALPSADPASVTGRSILGRPVWSTPAVPAGTAWGLDGTRAMLVTRLDASIEVDASVYFSSDRVAVRGKMRAALALVHPAACAQIVRSNR